MNDLIVRRRQRILIAWAGVVAGLVVMFYGIAQAANGNSSLGWLIFVGVIGWVAAAIYGLVSARIVVPTRITDTYVWLKGVRSRLPGRTSRVAGIRIAAREFVAARRRRFFCSAAMRARAAAPYQAECLLVRIRGAPIAPESVESPFEKGSSMELKIQAYSLLGTLPSFAVWFVGGILCIRRYWRDPTACLLTGAAIVIAASTCVVLPIVTTFVFTTFFQNVDNIAWRVLANSVAFSIPQAVAWGLMFWAIFGASRYSEHREAQ